MTKIWLNFPTQTVSLGNHFRTFGALCKKPHPPSETLFLDDPISQQYFIEHDKYVCYFLFVFTALKSMCSMVAKIGVKDRCSRLGLGRVSFVCHLESHTVVERSNLSLRTRRHELNDHDHHHHLHFFVIQIVVSVTVKIVAMVPFRNPSSLYGQCVGKVETTWLMDTS